MTPTYILPLGEDPAQKGWIFDFANGEIKNEEVLPVQNFFGKSWIKFPILLSHLII